MTSLFWGLRLEPGKRYSTTVDKAFHVSMAALDCSSVKTESEVLSVMLEESESAVPFILCNLNKGKMMQSVLDLNFMTGDRVTFFCKGNGIVHLSGYIVPDDDEYGQLDDEEDDEDEEEEEDEEDSITENEERLGKKKLNGLVGAAKRALDDVTTKKSKKKKIQQIPEEEDSDDDDDDEEEEDLDMMEAMEGDSDMGEEEESDEDDDDDDDEEEEEEEEPKPSPPTSSKKDKKKAQAQQLTPTSFNNKQQSNKQKTPNGLTPQQQSGKKDKKNKGGDTPGGDTPKGGKGKEEGTPGKKTLEGGVSVKDIRVGQGALCKNGKMATVYYTGRLKSNHKVFDSVLQGAGFKFRVGRGEVIKGWDVGVNGMKVGGKRFITCPPQMAYGSKGVQPSIPPNSTLLFEVELINVQ